MTTVGVVAPSMPTCMLLESSERAELRPGVTGIWDSLFVVVVVVSRFGWCVILC